MKKIITFITLLSALTVTALATDETTDYAGKIITVFAGEDASLNKIELINVLAFVDAHNTRVRGSTSITSRMSREHNIGNATDFFIMERKRESLASQLIEQNDVDGDKKLTKTELAAALRKMQGKRVVG